jgi:hypothetical protein
MEAPKVFISHASEDKGRFVIPFAMALRAHGVDAWVDRWEMLPGDSLVDKIFEEGLKNAAAVVIVLSSISVKKPWVREELNAAFVNKINRGTKLIPVVIDACEVPEALKSVVWETVKDLNNIGECVGRVVDSIFGHTRKPELGNAPAYTSVAPNFNISGLNHTDATVLRLLFDHYLSNHPHDYIHGNDIAAAAGSQGMNLALIMESLDILASQHYAEVIHYLSPGPYPARITTRGISKILGTQEEPIVRKVGLAILNDQLKDGTSIAAATNLGRPLVEHALHRLEHGGHIHAVRGLGGETFIANTKATLRRMLTT